MRPLISVIMPAYNHEHYIQDAIKSIIAQTYKNIELLIIDDGSSDSTFQKILEMQKICKERFVRFAGKTQNNMGVALTLNQLISDAAGEYVYVIASDDLAKPYAIATQVEFLQNNHDYALVVGDNEIIDSNGDIAYWDKRQHLVYDKEKAKYLTFGAALKIKKRGRDFGSYLSLYAENHIPNGYMIRKSIFQKTGLYTSDAPLEDWYMNMQIAKHSKLKYLNQILFSYRWHDTNTIKNKTKMGQLYEATRRYEDMLLYNFNPIDLSNDMKDCIWYGRNEKLLTIIPNYIEFRYVTKGNMCAYLLRIWIIDILFKRGIWMIDILFKRSE